MVFALAHHKLVLKAVQGMRNSRILRNPSRMLQNNSYHLPNQPVHKNSDNSQRPTKENDSFKPSNRRVLWFLTSPLILGLPLKITFKGDDGGLITVKPFEH